jgi:multicomponent Na+:H+ antiporter subunit D
MLPYPVEFVPYTGSHVVFQLQLLLFSGLAFFLMLGWLKRTLTITLDVDWLYRRLGPALAQRLGEWADIWSGRLAAPSARALDDLFRVTRFLRGPHGAMARTWPTGTMAFWAGVLLVAYLLVFYLRSWISV